MIIGIVSFTNWTKFSLLFCFAIGKIAVACIFYKIWRNKYRFNSRIPMLKLSNERADPLL